MGSWCFRVQGKPSTGSWNKAEEADGFASWLPGGCDSESPKPYGFRLLRASVLFFLLVGARVLVLSLLGMQSEGLPRPQTRTYGLPVSVF